VSVPTNPAADRPDELTEFRVPVTVFASVRAVDYADAVFIAERAMRQAFRTSSLHRPDGPLTIQALFEAQEKPAVPVAIHRIYETGGAAANGLLAIEPTGVAYRKPEERAS
jgi:hypothetical protein